MLASAFLLLLSGTFFTLRLGAPSQGSFPRPLKSDEELSYVMLWVEKGDICARNKLIEHNLRLVAHITKKYYSQNTDQDDLISIGTIGLIKGVSTYKPGKNVRLATYCSRCIENEVLMYFRSLKKTAGEVSLSDTLDTDSDGNSLELIDILASDDDMLDRISSEEMSGNVRYLVNTVLEPRERRIISLRYGLEGAEPMPQREVAEICGISRSYVSRIEKKALEKLRKAFDC